MSHAPGSSLQIDFGCTKSSGEPENWSSYYESPTAYYGHEEDSLYGQETLTGADRPKAPAGRGQARLRLYRAGGGQGAGRKRSHLPPLEGSLRRDELPGGQTAQGIGERECSPKEAACRKRVGHRPTKRGESGKLLSPARKRRAVEHLHQRFE